MSWVDRTQAVRGILAEDQPDIVSLQFVPYAFHPAGLPFFLPRIVPAMVGRLPVQIMFHEIWIGAEVRAAWKRRVLGFCQRRIILSLVRSLNCRVIHTSNLPYVVAKWQRNWRHAFADVRKHSDRFVANFATSG
jgi:hypothetical protein